MTKTRSLALVAAVLMAGCSTNNYYGDQSGNYDNSGYYDQNAVPNDQYAGQYNDQPDVNVDVGVSFGSFQRELAPYGNWTYHPRWGDVWRPRAAGFRPYFDGYWANTREYGVIWVSNDPWGDVTTHYGRWVFDPRDGWMWVPGYVWGPSWVVWRSGGGSIGWFPMPPDDYYGEGPYRGRYDNFYGYRDWYGPSFGNDTFFSLWIFVGEDRFADRNYRNYVMPQRDYNRIIVNTTEVTNYVTVNNYIVNRSVNVERIERASNRRFEPVEARSVMKREARVTPVAAGRQIEQRERRERPIPANANANGGGNRNAREDVRDARQDARDARQDARDTREDVRDARQDLRDERRDNGPNLRVRQNEMPDGNLRGPQNAQGPQGGGNQADRRDERREERIDNRERVQAPQNANGPQQNGNAERNARGPRDNAQAERATGRAERAVERGGNNQNAVQPAGARRNEAAPVQAGGGDTEESREAERKARREEAAERRRNTGR
jgi:hypothetical protein